MCQFIIPPSFLLQGQSSGRSLRFVPASGAEVSSPTAVSIGGTAESIGVRAVSWSGTDPGGGVTSIFLLLPAGVGPRFVHRSAGFRRDVAGGLWVSRRPGWHQAVRGLSLRGGMWTQGGAA